MSNYPHQSHDLENDFNNLIEKLEINLKVFANQLAEKEQYTAPNHHLWREKQRIVSIIVLLKEQRDNIGQIDWI